MLSGHKILIVNDDGIHAPGIALMEKIVRRHTDQIWVVAPDEERSGASNSVSLHTPIRVRQLDERRFAIKGTPTDCVVMALRELLDEPPTLVLSGINRGANLGEDNLYSGTIAAAMEAAVFGLPAIALSQVFQRGAPIPWETAERYAADIIERVLSVPLPPGGIVNINFPGVPPEGVAGIRVVKQGRHPAGTFRTDARVDARDVPYYWIKLAHEQGSYDADSDLQAVRDGFVAVCPMHVDMTAYTMRAPLDAALSDLASAAQST